MSARIKHWTVRRSRRRVAGYWEVRNTHGIVAIVYTTEADAQCMAAAPKLHAYVKKQAKRGDVEALALINELEGN
jgi:hypothetical protein